MTYTRKQKEEYVTEIKTTVGCKNCGKEGPPETLHLHHIDGETKIDNVSSMALISSYSLEEVKNEIRKCEVLCQKCHVIHHAYSKQDCINALQEVAKELDKSPTHSEYREHKKNEHPSIGTIKNKFGSWDKSKQAACLSVFEQGKHNRKNKQECIDALQEVAERVDKSPSISEYKEHKKDKYPSYVTIRKKFGSWNKAKEAAGLSMFAHGRDKPHTKQDCIDALQQVAKDLDKSPYQSEYNDHRKDKHPSTKTIKKKFGCWNNAKEAANLTAFTKAGRPKKPAVDTQGQLSFDQFTQ